MVLQVTGCNRELEPEPFDTLHFPNDSGQVRTYEVFDTTFTVEDTIARHYFRQERVAGLEEDLIGRQVNVLEIWQAPIDSGSGQPGEYEYFATWQQWKSNQYAERIEGNIRFQVMQFPIEAEATWDGNAWNALDEDPTLAYGPFFYESIDTVMNVRGTTYEGVAKVRHRNVTGSLISQIDTWEAYAPGIGKIRRFDRFVRFNIDEDGEELSTDSYIYDEYLVDYSGFE